MYDIITIGSATQDVYVFSKKFKVLRDSRAVTGEVESFTFGTKIELDDILFEIGGGATNSAYTFARQGLKVGCVARIGVGGGGEEIRNFLKKSKIADLLIVDKKNRTAHSVIFLDKNGERTILVYRGAAHHFKTGDINLSKIKNTRWLYITSLAGNVNLLGKIVRFANKNKIKVALNPGKLEIRAGRSRILGIFKKTDILLLNREEAAEITGRSYSDNKGIIKDLHRLAGSNITVVTEGDQGSLVALKDDLYRVIIKPVKAVDTTGAGDAFGSGFTAGYLKSKGNIKTAIKLGCNNAASVVQKIGAKHGLLTLKSLKRKTLGQPVIKKIN